jgi:hypothetical protein
MKGSAVSARLLAFLQLPAASSAGLRVLRSMLLAKL